MEKLETRIRNHDREIEKMCNFHYQGFVDSITELLKVRGEAQKLKVRRHYWVFAPLSSSGVLISSERVGPYCMACRTGVFYFHGADTLVPTFQIESPGEGAWTACPNHKIDKK
jgi:hypothetical protein